MFVPILFTRLIQAVSVSSTKLICIISSRTNWFCSPPSQEILFKSSTINKPAHTQKKEKKKRAKIPRPHQSKRPAKQFHIELATISQPESQHQFSQQSKSQIANPQTSHNRYSTRSTSSTKIKRNPTQSEPIYKEKLQRYIFFFNS